MFGLVVARPETGVNNDARFVQIQNRRRSRSCAVIIVEHSTKTLAPMHRLRWCDDRGGPQELVCEALMIAFYVVVRPFWGGRYASDSMAKRGCAWRYWRSRVIPPIRQRPVRCWKNGGLKIHCTGILRAIATSEGMAYPKRIV